MPCAGCRRRRARSVSEGKRKSSAAAGRASRNLGVSSAIAESIQRAVAAVTAPKIGADSLFADLSSIRLPTEELSKAFADPAWSAAMVESLRQTSPERRLIAQSAIVG